MVSVSLVHAKAHLSELLDRVETGQEVLITRRDNAVARMSAVVCPRKPLPLEDLMKFREAMPRLRRPSAELLREIRNQCPQDRQVCRFAKQTFLDEASDW